MGIQFQPEAERHSDRNWIGGNSIFIKRLSSNMILVFLLKMGLLSNVDSTGIDPDTPGLQSDCSTELLACSSKLRSVPKNCSACFSYANATQGCEDSGCSDAFEGAGQCVQLNTLTPKQLGKVSKRFSPNVAPLQGLCGGSASCS